MPAENDTSSQVPSALKSVVQSHRNTSLFMLKLWRWAVLALAVLLPLGFLAQGYQPLLAVISGVLMWLVVGVVLRCMVRCMVYLFHRARASRVAETIDHRIPVDHTAREEIVTWISGRNSRGYLNALLEALGTPEWKTKTQLYPKLDVVFGVDEEPAEAEAHTQGQAQTTTYTYSQTQAWKDGQWVTTHAESSEGAPQNGPSLSADEIMQQAMAALGQTEYVGNGSTAAEAQEPQPAPGFEPIPIESSTEPEPEKKKRKRKSRWRKGKHMPLELDPFIPPADADADGGEESRRR